MDIEQAKILVKQAIKARDFAYVPYSNFSVGAALLTKTNKIYTGCNIESVSYSPTCCAERTAFFKAISDGEQSFEAIAVVGGEKNKKIQNFCPPCGVCLQVMVEFCDADKFEIILAESVEKIKVLTLKNLLPYGFKPEILN